VRHRVLSHFNCTLQLSACCTQLTLSDQPQFTLQLRVSLSDLEQRFFFYDLPLLRALIRFDTEGQPYVHIN